jgi:multidrug resistance efflux pump
MSYAAVAALFLVILAIVLLVWPSTVREHEDADEAHARGRRIP